MADRPGRAIILIAGGGGRLRPLTDDRPKGLLEVGDRSIVEHQIASLELVGIRDVVLVTGHGSEKVREQLGGRVTYVHNDRYLETNSLYSAWLAREFGGNGCLILNSDVVFHPALLERLLASPHPDSLLVDMRSGLGEEEMKVIVAGNGRVLRISKDLDPTSAEGENLGIVRLGPEGVRRFFGIADREIAMHHLNHWVPFAVDQMIPAYPFYAVSTEGLPWIEIDYAHDLKMARERVWPAIRGALKNMNLGSGGSRTTQ